MTVLQGNAQKRSEGSWVFTDQGVAADQGFRNVSQIWLPKTLTYEQGIEQIETAKAEREDILFSAQNVIFAHNGKTVCVSVDDRDFKPTDWSARQLCNWFGVPQTLWTYYMDNADKPADSDDLDLVVHAFQNGQRKYDDKDKTLLFRTYKDGSLRGVMSEKYSIVDNVWYINTLKEFMPGGRLSHWRGDADTLYGNLLIPDTIRAESDSEYGGMLSISNCEIGRRVVAQRPSIFRAICMNGCIWGATKGEMLRERHIRIKLEVLRQQILENIDKQIPLLKTGTAKLVETHKLPTEANVAHVFAAIAKRHTLTTEVVGEFAAQWQAESNEKSAFGVIDAITRAGQKFSADVWVKCDEIAGGIVNDGEDGWKRLNNLAKSLTDKELGKIYGIAV